MKKSNLLLIAALAIMSLDSCKSDMDFYDTKQEWLAFRFYSGQDSIARKTFMYDSDDITRDTLYIDLHLIGYLTDYDRPVKLMQVDVENEVNAVPGVHYVPFDNEEYSSQLVVKANDGTPQIPIIVLRDSAMKRDDHVLRLTILENEYFKPWNAENEIYKTIVITDKLTRPEAWSAFFFGKWGPVKHQFLIDNFPSITWDNDLFELLENDYAYGYYLQAEAQERLAEVNAEREANGEGPLRERDGSIIRIEYEQE